MFENLTHCTPNREYDYDCNAFHMPKDEDGKLARFSASYLCNLYGGTMFNTDMCPQKTSKVIKVAKCICAWVFAIFSLGILPSIAKRNYLSQKNSWEVLKNPEDYLQSERLPRSGDFLKSTLTLTNKLCMIVGIESRESSTFLYYEDLHSRELENVSWVAKKSLNFYQAPFNNLQFKAANW